ncbi:MAG: hypothetical protein A3J27_12665 [Candidatus Tectomicrobia bacterium RIFCSPLOWO2_12_FULL_69_37]|nr:MAG: hypothetical protein A3I72_00180 [Candidatus Tectomicrobia bacterium RIFCSPLOWO2_02_FULL_70_19]OGL65698.1 MAG: hypothetical protein A3J27_12665 [Candidatus Tectomicrobia bacterium RIFCSPLOWO2_12_FULL_69_37]
MRARRRAMFFLGAGLALLALALLEPGLAIFESGLALGAEAGEAHAKAFSLKEELFKLINTLVVIAILYKLTAKPLRNYLGERREDIRKALAEAERTRREAEQVLEEHRSKVADLEAELGRVRKTGQEERQVLQVRLQAEHETQVKRLVDQTRNTIDIEMAKARAELQNEAARLAVELAEQILAKNLGPEDQERIAGEFLASLDAVKGADR